MKAFLARLREGELLIGDGGLGTQLMERGLPPGTCPETMNREQPEVLEEIAREYAEAGAEIVTTNTFGATPLKLSLYGLADAVVEINTAAVQAARRAVGDRAYVAGCMGPTGRMLKPYGDTEPEAVREGYETQARTLVGAGVDVVFVETMTDLAEAVLAVRAARGVTTDLPIVATMTFDRTPRGFFTIMGVDIPTAATELAEAGAEVVGSNCGTGIETMIDIVGAFRACTPLPLIAQANAGLPEQVQGRTVYDETPQFTAARAEALVAAGASIIGGCCGTTPAHIRALRNMIKG